MDFNSEINSVINNLCIKLRIDKDYLIPKFQQYKIISSIYGITISSLIIIICFIFCIVFTKKMNKYRETMLDDYDKYVYFTIFNIISVCGIVFLFGVLLYNIYICIMWNISPEVMTIKYIIDLLNTGS